MSNKEIELSCEVLGESEKAYKLDFGTKECWIPKSQINDYMEEDNSIVSVFIPEWLAFEKGLI